MHGTRKPWEWTWGVVALSLVGAACDAEKRPAGAPPPFMPERGAQVPWTEYQAEEGRTNATVLGPSRTRHDAAFIEAEAVGREAVRLDKTGDFVAITTRRAANALVVRLSIPDAPTGGGLEATLGLYVNGRRVRSLPVTSRYAWVYQGEDSSLSNDPARGAPQAFFDEVRARVDALPVGTEVMLRKDAEDTAAFYVVDLLDLEWVPPPLERPADLVSITDFGAMPDDGVDDREALQRALDVVASEGRKGVWIPPGTFLLGEPRTGGRGPSARGLSVPGVQLRGAGPWYSTLTGPQATLSCQGEGGCHFADFSLFGEVDHWDDAAPAHGFHGGLGRDSVIENVWVEHVTAGIWAGSAGDPHPTDGLVVKNSRFRDLSAQGIGFPHGTRNSVVEHSHVRNTGGDALALGSARLLGDTPVHDNVWRNNSVQLPWRASCFALYGGYDNRLERSTCEDVPAHPGLLVDHAFDSHPFAPTTVLEALLIIRAGSPAVPGGGGDGALCFSTSRGSVHDLVAAGIELVEPTSAGLQFQGHADSPGADFSRIQLDNVTVTGAGTYGVEVLDGARGEVSFAGVTVSAPGQGALHAPGVPESFFKRLAGNRGW